MKTVSESFEKEIAEIHKSVLKSLLGDEQYSRRKIMKWAQGDAARASEGARDPEKVYAREFCRTYASAYSRFSRNYREMFEQALKSKLAEKAPANSKAA